MAANTEPVGGGDPRPRRLASAVTTGESKEGPLQRSRAAEDAESRQMLLRAIRGVWETMGNEAAAALRCRLPLVEPALSRAVAESIGALLVQSLTNRAGEEIASEALRRLGIETADGRVPLDGLRAAVNDCVAALHGEVAGAMPDAAAVIEVSRAALSAQSRAVGEASDAYATRRAHSEAAHLLASERFVDRVLTATGEPGLSGLPGEVAADAGWGLAVLVSPDAPALREGGIWPASAIEGPALFDPAPHLPALVPVEDASAWPRAVAELTTRIPAGVWLFATTEPVSLADIGVVYRQHRAALHFAPLFPATGLLDTAALSFARGLAAVPEVERAEFFWSVLGPLLRAGERRAGAVFDSLDRLVAAGSAKRAQELFGVSPRTMERHVSELRAVCGRNWNDPADRFLLQVAVTYRRLAALLPGGFAERVWGPHPKTLLRREGPK